MLLENECEKLKNWFEREYPDGRILIHLGKNEDLSEECHIEFHIYNKHFASELSIPPGSEDQDREFITKFKEQFLEVQKAKISKAVNQIRMQ